MFELIKKFKEEEETKREVMVFLFEAPKFMLASVSTPVEFARVCSREAAEMFVQKNRTSGLFLGVADIRVERLQDVACAGTTINNGDAFVCRYDDPGFVENVGDKKDFRNLWDSTVRDGDLDRYGWDANPLVYVYSFDS